MKNEDNRLATRTIDLLPAPDRFSSSTTFYTNLHRGRVLCRKYWWVGFLLLLLLGAPIYLYTANSPPTFESKAKMWLTGRLNLSENRLYTEELINYLGTQAELLRSSTIQQRALAKVEHLIKEDQPTTQSNGNGNFVQSAKETIKGLFPQKPQTASEEPVRPFPFGFKVVEGSRSSTLELKATGSDPSATRAYLDAVMNEYLQFKRELREETSDKTVASIGSEVAELARQLNVQQERLHAFQSTNNLVFLQEQGSSAGSYLALLNKQLANLRTELQFLMLLQPDQLLQMDRRPVTIQPVAGSVPETGSKDMLAGLVGPQSEMFKASQQLHLLKAKREELAKYLKPLHPKIAKLDEEIATQDTLMRVAKDEAMAQLVQRRKTIQLEIQTLESATTEWDTKAIDASRKMAEYDSIRQNLQRLQNGYDKLLGMIDTVDVGKKLDQENCRILEAATAPKAVPKMQRNMAVALFGSLLTFGAFLFIKSKLDDRFMSVQELSDYFSLEIVGAIPSISIRKPKPHLSMAYLERQKFEFLESFRNIRSSLLFTRNGVPTPKTIAISSSIPKEGKSTVAFFLAATMAMGRSRVLLIDGDMRRPAQHQFFGKTTGPGLAGVLNGEASFQEAVLSSKLENLSFMPAGRPKRNPGELILGREWPQLLEAAAAEYDFVIIDTPPILATDDATVLTSKTDAVLFVLRSFYTSARDARDGLSTLTQRGANVRALILNRAVYSPYADARYKAYKHEYSWAPQPARALGEGQLAANEAKA